MTRGIFRLGAFVLGAAFTVAGPLRPVDRRAAPDLFVASDTCNVYVLRQGDAALLIDCGDGSVLEHLAEIGVRRVEWVLFTHHHREQCQGAARLRAAGARFAAPEQERAFFERPADFRQMEVSLGDPFTVYGASYVRPPVEPIALDRALGTNEVFEWRGQALRCVATAGNSPGALTYCWESGTQVWAFSGDVMLAGARMHTWFDTEWDYGFAAGLRALRESVDRLQALAPAWLLPSHGDPIRRPRRDLQRYAERLRAFERLYVRGYGVEEASVEYQDKVSTPSTVSNVVQVLPHLFKFKRPKFWPNFNLILAESGRALLVDCGLLDEAFLDTALADLRTQYGLKAIDAIVVTHMHGDHFLEAPHLREKWGAQIWALENMVDKMEHPEWFDYAAPIQAYGKKAPDGSPLRGVRVDRAFRPGETFDWEGYRFTVDWMPGQTEFALCLHGRIDGRLVAFTGDNIFGDPEDVTQTGHEAMVAHNSAVLEEGYIYGAEFLRRLRPDLLVGGHSFVMDRPARFIERYRRWAYAMRDAFRELSSEADYRYGFDPFWLRAAPYRVVLAPGGNADAELHLRNFLDRPQRFQVSVACPEGVVAEPATFEGTTPASSITRLRVRFRAAAAAPAGVHLVGLDATLDGRRYGQRFDVVLGLAAAPGPAGERAGSRP